MYFARKPINWIDRIKLKFRPEIIKPFIWDGNPIKWPDGSTTQYFAFGTYRYGPNEIYVWDDGFNHLSMKIEEFKQQYEPFCMACETPVRPCYKEQARDS